MLVLFIKQIAEEQNGYCEFISKVSSQLNFEFPKLNEKTSLEWFAPFILDERKKREKEHKKIYKKLLKAGQPYDLTSLESARGISDPAYDLARGISDPAYDLATKPSLAQKILKDQKRLDNLPFPSRNTDFSKATDVFSLDAYQTMERLELENPSLSQTMERLELENPSPQDYLNDSLLSVTKNLNNNSLLDNEDGMKNLASTSLLASHQVINTFDVFDSAQQALTSLDNYQNSLRDDLYQPSNYLDVIDSVQNYVDNTQNLLKAGTGTTEQALFEHREIESRFTSIFFELPNKRQKTSKKKLKKTIRKKDQKILDLERKLERITKELGDEKLKTKALSINAISHNNVENINKPKKKRTSQLHTLVRKVDQSLTENGDKPSAKDVLRELERNYDYYDDESIITEITDDDIHWQSKRGVKQSFKIKNFDSLLSKLRNVAAKP